jgi:hypothetical protein
MRLLLEPTSIVCRVPAEAGTHDKRVSAMRLLL